MNVPSAIAIYFLFWVFSAFFVLPFGMKTADEAGVEKIPGQADSAPHAFHPGTILLRVTIVATILFVLFFLNYEFGWITPDMLDWYND